jgi:serine/threonine-protein kinase RsbW
MSLWLPALGNIDSPVTRVRDGTPSEAHMTGTSRAIPAIDPMALDLPFSPESAGVARQHLVEWMHDLGAGDETSEDARLVVSELVGNAVRHARPLADGTMHVAWKSRDYGIDIAVSDGGALTTPERVEAGVSDLAGRGLSIVETLAARWWVESTRSRTTVHALLALA